MELLQYLLKNYGHGEPIFSDALRKKMKINDTTLRQNLKRLVDREQLIRYEKGIYFIAKPNSLLKKKTLSFNKVIKNKYLYDEDKQIGYRMGIAFANDLNLTTQNAGVIELVTNKETNRKRKVVIKNRTITLRKPRAKITDKNYKVLQVLDIITDIEKMSEKPIDITFDRIINYVAKVKMDKNEIDKILRYYPMKTKVKAYESGLYNALTQK